MTFRFEVLKGDYPRAAARIIAADMPVTGSVVLTGGTTAERIYPELAQARSKWEGIELFFSDERCVPPDDPASNYGMAKRLLLDTAGIDAHRMRGEADPDEAALDYHKEIGPFVDRGLDLVLLGMGADAHVGAMFPGSPTLTEQRLCAPVARPDGMSGLTLTPPALLSGARIRLLVTGEAKAATVARVIEGDEPVEACPARMFASHPDVAFLLDEAAASQLTSS